MSAGGRELREILTDYATHRELLWQFVLRDLRIRYKQAVMGFLWALFLPLLLVGAGILVRLAMSGAGSAVDPVLIGSVALRSVLWAGFAGAVGFGTASLVGNATLVGKVYFPREILPLSATLSSAVDASIALTVVVIALPWLGGQFSLALLWVPVLLVIWLVGTFACVLALSAANLFFRDVKYLVQALLSVGVLLTPVFYSSQELGTRAAALMQWHPMTAILEGITLVVFSGHNLAYPLVVDGVTRWTPPHLWIVATGCVLALVLSSIAFHRAEDLFAERV